VSLRWPSLWNVTFFPSVLWCCWLGDRKGIQPVKTWVLVYWLDNVLSSAHHIAQFVTTTSVTLSSNIIQNGDILVPAYLGCREKWPLNECHHPSVLWHSCVSDRKGIRCVNNLTPANCKGSSLEDIWSAWPNIESLTPFEQPFSRWTWVSRYHNGVSPFWILLEPVVTTGAIRCAKLQSPSTNQHPVFNMLDAFPVPNQQCQSTEGKSTEGKPNPEWSAEKNRQVKTHKLKVAEVSDTF